MEAHNGAMAAHPGALETDKNAVDNHHGVVKGLKSIVADSHHFDEDLDQHKKAGSESGSA